MALGFLKLHRSDQALALLSADPKAFNLLTWIAFRASRETGEALIGDWKLMGATSEAAYRRTKKRLEATGLATFKPTSKGNTRNKEYTPRFLEFWEAFPKNRRGNKRPAFAEWQKIPPELHQQIINHVRTRCECDAEWLKENFRYVQHAERFLKHERFYDEFEERRDVRERIFDTRWSTNEKTRDSHQQPRSSQRSGERVIRDISHDLPQLDEGQVG